MQKYSFKEISDKNTWEKFVVFQNPQTFLQSWNWGEINKSVGEKTIRLGFYEDDKLVGICLLIKQSAKRGPHFLIPAGPLINWDDKLLVNFVIQSITNLAKKEKVWFIRIRPEIISNKKNKDFFREIKMIPSPMHLHAENTWILDITKTESEILSQMRKTTRYLIRKGMKEELIVKISEDPKIAKILFKLQKETSIRHGFVGFSEKLFEKEIEIFSKDNQCKVFSVAKGNNILVVAIIIFYAGVAYYHFSGSTSEFSKIPFSYHMQWEIIKYAKKNNISLYNFWGIAPDDNPRHRFAGVTLFKTGFGGKRIDWLHAHDLPISPLYYLTYIFETLRRIFRRL